MGNATSERKYFVWGSCVALVLSLMMNETVAATAATTASMADVVCRLAIPAQLARDQPATLTVTLRNRGKQTLHLLKRNTPLEGWMADSLNVEHEGQPVAYSGAMAKRMPPSASEYLHLKPGARHTYPVRLQDGYDVSAPGSYRITWRGEVMDAYIGTRKPNAEHFSPQTIACEAVTFVRTAKGL